MKLAVRIGLIGAALFATLPSFAVERTERGALVMEDIPAIPDELAERTNRYQQTRSASMVGWLDNGKDLLISTRFAETAQIHQVAMPGGARTQLTFFAEPVADAEAAPDGNSFLFTKDVGGNEFYQVYSFDLRSGDIKLLSDGKSRNGRVRWSGSGKTFAYTTTRRNGHDTDVVIGRPGSTDVLAVTESQGSWSALDFSPDDGKLLLGRFVSSTESELYIADIHDLKAGSPPELKRFHATKTPVSFGTARFSRDGKGVYLVSDEGNDFQQLRYENLDGSGAKVLTADTPWDVTGFEITRGGTYLAYVVNADGVSQLRILNLKTGSPMAAPKLPIGVISGLTFDGAGRQLAFAMNNARSPSDVFSFEVDGGGSGKPAPRAKGKSKKATVASAGAPTLTRWTTSETGGLDASTFTEPELFHYKSFDGLDIPAFYYRGRGAGPRPVLIQIHGGPESQALPTFNSAIEYYVREMGISVLVPNVRGSSGYGKRYLQLDNGKLREDSVKDIGALLDWIRTQPALNADRVAVMGGSYGGYMVLASMTHYNERLRGGIDVVGISNWITFLTNTQDYRRDLRRVEYGDETDPQMRDFLDSISPLNNAAKITKPMFIVQGANDPRVPVTESEQMVKTIRANGGEVWYLLAQDEGHGFRKKFNRDYNNNATMLFLDKILLH